MLDTVMLGLGLGLGLACQGLVNNVLPLKLSSCMSHDAFDCVNKVQVVDCPTTAILSRTVTNTELLNDS